MKTQQEIRKARVYTDLFSENESESKRQYREYCKLYHPDSNDSSEASELFAIINEIYNTRRRSSVVRATVEEDITFKDIKTDKGFVISNPVIFKTGISMIYHTATKVVMVYHKSYEKFFNNYLKVVSGLKYADSNMEKEFKRYFPSVLKHFETDNDNMLILLDKTSEVLNLGKIVNSYESMGKLFPEKQAAWIMNRLYNIACYLNYNGLVSNGLTLENLWVSPEMHSVLLLGGWEYTTKIGDSMIGCPKEVFNILPIKVKDSKKSSTITDLESIKAIGRKLFKGHNDLTHINKFINYGINNDNPFDEWDEYGKAVKEQFGKREFIVWDNVPYN